MNKAYGLAFQRRCDTALRQLQEHPEILPDDRDVVSEALRFGNSDRRAAACALVTYAMGVIDPRHSINTGADTRHRQTTLNAARRLGIHRTTVFLTSDLKRKASGQ